jgi:Fe-S cluster biogenesis protein NfuA
VTRALDTEAIEARIDQITRLMDVHAGGLELVGVSDDGVVRVRFTGMCTGCPNRPLTTAWAVKPGLLDLDGVSGVEIEGSRISAEAEERLMRYIGPYLPGARGAPRSPVWSASDD